MIKLAGDMLTFTFNIHKELLSTVNSISNFPHQTALICLVSVHSELTN